jgi:hypothetical protein
MLCDDEIVFRNYRNEIISAMKELMAEYKYIKQIYGLDDWVIFIFKIY